MRTAVTIASLVAVLAACATLAPGQSPPPTRVRQFGLYQCPDHPEIQATWPAQCPTCGTTLQAVEPRNIAAGTVLAADINYPDQYPAPSPSLNQPYAGPGYYPGPQSTQYNTQYGYPPSNQYAYPPGTQYGYPPSGQYGTQAYPPSNQYSQGYPPSTQYGYPPNTQYGYPPSTQYGYPPSGQYGTQGYPPSTQYGQGYPPGTQYGYPPSGQYAYPPGSPPPYNPNYGYGQGGYPYPPNYPYEQTEPNNPYSGILQDLNRLFHR
jgi:hypothetical protein